MRLVVAAAMLAAPAVVFAQAGAEKDVVVVKAADYAQALTKTNAQGHASANLPHSAGTTASVIRRVSEGLVDIHGAWNEQFVFLSGKATMNLGGKLVGGKETGPGEVRGGRIEGGESHEVGAGDVVWVKAGVPHQLVVPNGGEIRYVIFKDTTK